MLSRTVRYPLKSIEAKQVRLGFWYSRDEPDLPMPIAESASKLQVKTMLDVLTKLEEQSTRVYYRGWSACRICGKPNGSTEFRHPSGLAFPEGLRHYVEQHQVLVPDLLNRDGIV